MIYLQKKNNIKNKKNGSRHCQSEDLKIKKQRIQLKRKALPHRGCYWRGKRVKENEGILSLRSVVVNKLYTEGYSERVPQNYF